jgi:hypothetical protein
MSKYSLTFQPRWITKRNNSDPILSRSLLPSSTFTETVSDFLFTSYSIDRHEWELWRKKKKQLNSPPLNLMYYKRLHFTYFDQSQQVVINLNTIGVIIWKNFFAKWMIQPGFEPGSGADSEMASAHDTPTLLNLMNQGCKKCLYTLQWIPLEKINWNQLDFRAKSRKIRVRDFFRYQNLRGPFRFRFE